MPKPTIREVAARAGVSISVASNALNHKGRVSKETRRRVEAAARAIGYVPSYTARRLRGAGKAIGILVITTSPDETLSTRYFGESLHTLLQAVAQADYKLHYIYFPNQEFDETQLRRTLSDDAVDGLVVMAPPPSKIGVITRALKSMPYVLFSVASDQEGVSYVDSDGRSGALSATRHLIALGHTRVAYVMPYADNFDAVTRRQGYEAAMAEADLTARVYVPPDGCVPRAVKAMLVDEITAVLTFDDICALEVIGELGRCGRRVPHDMAVIGFDDDIFGQWMCPRLTTVRQPLSEMAAISAEYLIRRFESDGEVPPCHRVLPVELVVRESCGASLRAGG